MTVRFAYYPPGADEPSIICESMASVYNLASAAGDHLPRTKPVTLGPLATPTGHDIWEFIETWMTKHNTPWEKGFDRYLANLHRDIKYRIAGLEAQMGTFTTQHPGYVVDKRNVEAIKERAGVKHIHTGEVFDSEEEE